jgi:hypothetical protein
MQKKIGAGTGELMQDATRSANGAERASQDVYEVEKRVFEILAQAKRLAREYYSLTGKPLGVTGEVAEYECARLLGLKLAPARTPGYDAIRPSDGRRLQIKGRCILPTSSPGQRVPKIDIRKEFDGVLLVLLDENFDATGIFEADRPMVVDALTAPGSKARNERGALGLSKFKSIGRKIWPEEGEPL